MTAPTLTAEYLPAMGMPAICIDNRNHALSIAAAEELILTLQHAVLRARIDAKKHTAARRLITPENEFEQLLQAVDLRLSQPDTLPSSSPASEVTP